MKKLLCLAMAISCSLIGMEPPEGSNKDKLKARVSDSSGSASSSNAVLSQFDTVDLKDEKSAHAIVASSQGGILVIHSLEELEAIMRQQGDSDDTKAGKRRSIIVMPKMDLDAINRQITPPTIEQDFQDIVDFYKETLKQKGDVDISRVERRLIQKLKEIHDSPPTTPVRVLNDDANKLKKAQSAIQVLRRATVHQTTLRTHREQMMQQSPVVEKRTRNRKPLEILEDVAQDPNVHDNLAVLKDIAFQLLNEKLGETQDSKTKTTWIVSGLGALGSLAAAGLTYLGTKHNC